MSEGEGYKLSVAAPIFSVTDLKRATNYYCDVLMFELTFDWADHEDEPVRYAILTQNDTEIHLTLSEKTRETVAYFFVDGVANYYEVLKTNEATITSPLEDLPWEMREFEVTDPDGNRLIFGEHLSRIQDA